MRLTALSTPFASSIQRLPGFFRQAFLGVLGRSLPPEGWAYWQLSVPAGKPVVVHGVVLAGRMVYISDTLTAVSHTAPEPAAIQPTLPVRFPDVRLPLEKLPPSPEPPAGYAALTPRQRAAYLLWLSNGAEDPSHLNFAWLYFYGLERRLLLESPVHEWSSLVLELYRLRQVFAYDASFEDATRRLLETVAIVHMLQHRPDCTLASLPYEALLQWEGRLLFQGFLSAKAFRQRKQALLVQPVYEAANPGMGRLCLHALLRCDEAHSATWLETLQALSRTRKRYG